MAGWYGEASGSAASLLLSDSVFCQEVMEAVAKFFVLCACSSRLEGLYKQAVLAG